MGKQANDGSGGRQENKRWSLIHGPRFLTVFLIISMIHVSTQSSRVCNTEECVKVASQIKKSMNLKINPCDDFYEYACGKWSENNPRPPGYSYYSLFDKVESTSEEYKKNQLEKARIDVQGATTEVQQMPSNLYKSCMDLKAIENAGAEPLKERIRELGGWDMSGDWDEDTWDFKSKLLAIHQMTSGKVPVFKVQIINDLEDSTKRALSVFQAAPALAKDEYRNLSSKTIKAYKKFIIDVVVLLGGDASTTAKKADEIICFEAQLANITVPAAEQQEAVKQLTGRTLTQLQQEVPELNWVGYFNDLFAPFTTIQGQEFIILPASLTYLKKAMKIVHNSNTKKSVLANYLVWYVIRNEINWLSAPYRNAFQNYMQATTGATSEQERWKTCVGSATKSFKDVISAKYVQEYNAKLVGPKNIALKIVNEVTEAFEETVKSLKWLDGATRSLILQKVNGMGTRVSFADYMLNSTKLSKLFEKYKGLTIGSQTHFKNKVSILKKTQQQLLKDFRKPVDNTTWYLSPLNAESENDLQSNILTFPAAMVQPPIVFPSDTLRALSFGNLGSEAGKNILYGFGTTGRSFNEHGLAYKNGTGWSPGAIGQFDERRKCYIKQYSAYKVSGKWPVNAVNTAYYNVADNGGLKLALKAYYKWVNQDSSDKWKLPGLTFNNEQLFYIGFAQKFCSSATPERRKQTSLTKPFADDKFRVIGPLANSCEFANAFACNKYSPMNPVNKCYLWSKEGLQKK